MSDPIRSDCSCAGIGAARSQAGPPPTGSRGGGGVGDRLRAIDVGGTCVIRGCSQEVVGLCRSAYRICLPMPQLRLDVEDTNLDAGRLLPTPRRVDRLN